MGRTGVRGPEVRQSAQVRDKDDMQNRGYMIDEAME